MSILLYRVQFSGRAHWLATLPGGIVSCRKAPWLRVRELFLCSSKNSLSGNKLKSAGCKDKPIVRLLPMPAKTHVRLVVTGSEVFTGRIKDGFGPIVCKKRKSVEFGSSVDWV